MNQVVNTIAIKIGILSIGLRTEFELGFYRDIQPPHLNEDVVVTNNKSESGVFLVIKTKSKLIFLTT